MSLIVQLSVPLLLLTMFSKLAHDLHDHTWRSDDVCTSNYLNHATQVEINAPHHLVSKSGDINLGFELNRDSILKNTDYSTFSSIKINSKIVDSLKRCGFVRPSPIQTACIPLGRLGLDLIAQSKSGTGKTIVFVACALEMLVLTLSETPCPRVLVLTPTREIAVQVGDIINTLTADWTNFSCFKAIGGTKVSENISNLDKSQIIVGTPGRICCLLQMNFLKAQSIRLFILDECDKLMDDNFKKQIDKILAFLPSNKQMIVTSATLSDEMTAYLSKYMHNPAMVRLDADQPALIGVAQYLLKVKGHSLDYMNFEAKLGSLLEVLKSVQFNQCFIFLNFQTRAKYLYDKLKSEGWAVAHISGEMCQKDRLEVFEQFRRHKYRILVSTDLTSRGIDVETVNLVINIDVPFDCETYLHRIGRAGRFGSSGIAITIAGQGDDYQRFYDLTSQYNLMVKEITLPLNVNLWSTFHRDRLEDSVGQLNAAIDLLLPLNEHFAQVRSQYESLQTADTIQCDLTQLNCKQENISSSFAFSLFNELTNISSLMENFYCDDPNKIDKLIQIEDDKSKKEEILPQNELSQYKSKTYNIKDSSMPTSTEVEEKVDLTVESQSDINQNRDYSEDNFDQFSSLFHSAFLAVKLPITQEYPKVIQSNLKICKYLLKGHCGLIGK